MTWEKSKVPIQSVGVGQDSSLDPEELAATSMETLGEHMVFADALTRAEKEKRVPARAMVGARGWKIPSRRPQASGWRLLQCILDRYFLCHTCLSPRPPHPWQSLFQDRQASEKMNI